MVDYKSLLSPPVRKDVRKRRCTCRSKNIQVHSDRVNHYRYQNARRVAPTQPWFKRRYAIIIGVVALVLLLFLILYLTGAFSTKSKELVPPNPIQPLPPSPSKLHVFKKGAVCADGPPCAEIGRNILKKNGTAVDAAIAAMFCNGVYTMQSMGLGGGFLMTIYINSEKKAYSLNAREKAPMRARPEIYKDDALKSRAGPLAIAVPGELKGYWEAHKRFGFLPWEKLVQPAIELCEKGYNMTQHQYSSLFKRTPFNDPNLDEWFKNKDGSFKEQGSLIRPTKLCETLKVIAANGGEDLYTGKLSKDFAHDLRMMNTLVTKEDLEKYEPEWQTPISVKFKNGDRLYSSPVPGSGVLLGFILKVLDGFNLGRDSIMGIQSTISTFHKITEVFKYAYAKRTELGDMNFVNISTLIDQLTSDEYTEAIRKKVRLNSTSTDPKEYGAVYYTKGDHGTAHISVISPNGDAVSVTSSVNIYYGAGLTSESTGIVLNSVMDDFSFPYFKNFFELPTSPNNALKPGKRPLSSMCPTIIVNDKGDVRLVIGASGGSRITSGVAQVIMRSLWFGENIKEAVDAPRIHHQLHPMRLEYEYGTLQQVVDGLKAIGHNMIRTGTTIVCAILKEADKIIGNADFRKGGDVYGL